MTRKDLHRGALLFGVGMGVGPLLDAFHTHSDTLAYAEPWFFRMARWTPPLFGAATVAIACGVPLWDSMFKRPRSRLSSQTTWIQVGAGLAVFIIAYFASGFWPAESLTKTAALTAIGLALWMEFDRTWQGLLAAAIIAVTGCTVEVALIALGGFHYLRPDFSGIPYWLAPLYLCAATAVGNLGRKLFTGPVDTF